MDQHKFGTAGMREPSDRKARTAYRDTEKHQRDSEQRFQMHQLQRAMKEAEGRKTTLLCEILRSDKPVPLTRDFRDKLAGLIDQYVEYRPPPIRGRGRPRGPDPSPRARAMRLVVHCVKQEEAQWRKANARRRVPEGVREKIINEWGEQLADDGFFEDIEPQITVEEIWEILQPGKR